MRLEQWPSLKTDRWGFLKKVASGLSGKYCEVVPSWGIPASSCVPPYQHFSRIHIPSSITGPLLNGSLAHEILHVLDSKPAAFAGISWGVFLIANSLEDARLECQLALRWPGLVSTVDELSCRMAEFCLRERARASSVESCKLYEVGLALYYLLKGFPEELSQRTVAPMALETARELLPLAMPALEAPHSFAIVEIAEKILEEIVKAAERAAARMQTSSASSWVSSLRSEVQKAMSTPVEAVLIALGKPKWEGIWWGPWYKGEGAGYSFYSTPWSWDEAAPTQPLNPASATGLAKILEEADPTLEKPRLRFKALRGQLVMFSQTLVMAALGRERRVFVNVEEVRDPLLPELLANLELIVFGEAHNRYTKAEAKLLKDVVASLARLFSLVQAPVLVVRVWTCFRKKETVQDPETKRTWERWSDDFYIRIRTLKASDDPVWSEKAELLLATLPLDGFNHPLEGYSRLRSWELKLPDSRRPRVYICVGSASEINVVRGHLKYATESLRRAREKVVYVNVAPLPYYSDEKKEFEEAFDAFVQGNSVPEIVVGLLRALIELLA